VSEDVEVSEPADTPPGAPATTDALRAVAKPPRGWVSLYALAFVLLLGAGAAMGASAVGLLASTRLLWTCTVLSGAAILVAVLSVVLPHR
jgi:hypothetical protein